MLVAHAPDPPALSDPAIWFGTTTVDRLAVGGWVVPALDCAGLPTLTSSPTIFLLAVRFLWWILEPTLTDNTITRVVVFVNVRSVQERTSSRDSEVTSFHCWVGSEWIKTAPSS